MTKSFVFILRRYRNTVVISMATLRETHSLGTSSSDNLPTLGDHDLDYAATHDDISLNINQKKSKEAEGNLEVEEIEGNQCERSTALAANLTGQDAAGRQTAAQIDPVVELLPVTSINKNRCIMTIVHYILTYPCTSFMLFVIFAMMTYPLPTYEEQVSTPFRYLEQVVKTEENLYYDCIVKSFQRMNVSNDMKLRLENVRVFDIQLANQHKLDHLQDLSSRCYNTSITMQRALQKWYEVTEGFIPFYLSNVTNLTSSSRVSFCSPNDQGMLNQTLHHPVLDDVNASVMSVFNDFASKSIATLEKVIIYSRERTEYDYNYFIQAKIQPAITLIHTFSPPTIALNIPTQQIEIELRVILQDLMDSLKVAAVQIDLLTERILSFKSSIDEFYINYIDLYDRFASIVLFVRDFIPEPIKLPSMFDISKLPTADMMLPILFEIPTFDITLPDNNILLKETLDKVLELISSVLLEAAKDASEQTKNALNKLLERLQEILTLEDYKPPKYPSSDTNTEIQNPDDELVYLNNIAEQSKDQTRDALQTSWEKDYEVLPTDSSFYEMDNISDEELSTIDVNRFTWMETSIPNIRIPSWLVILVVWMFNHAIIIELITQFIRLWYIKRRYEKNSQPDFFEIDYTKDNSGENKDVDDIVTRVTQNMREIRMFVLNKIMNPWIILGIMFIPMIFIIFIFWFPHVKESCIDSRRGTALARKFLAPTLINKANIKGSTLYSNSVISCRQKMQSDCLQRKTETSLLNQNDSIENDRFVKRLNDSIQTLDIFGRCVDIQKLDMEFSTNCCGLEGYSTELVGECTIDQQTDMCPIDWKLSPPQSFPPLGHLMERMESLGCKDWIPLTNPLEDSTFNCKAIQEACKNVLCSGVESSLILQLTIDADCSAEAYAIQVCVFVAYAIVHAIVINIMNKLLFNGIQSLFWRKIVGTEIVGQIKLFTYLNEKGEIIKGTDLHDRSMKVAKAIQRYEEYGRIQLFASAFLFIIWIASFFILKRIATTFDVNN